MWQDTGGGWASGAEGQAGGQEVGKGATEGLVGAGRGCWEVGGTLLTFSPL